MNKNSKRNLSESMLKQTHTHYTYMLTKCLFLFRLLKAAQTVHEEAEKMYESGDEENAYIFYMKYFNLIMIIQKSKDFSKYKDETRKVLGTKQNIDERFDKLEKLKNSLRKR